MRMIKAFYTLGRGRDANVYVFALKLKKFVFSNEVIETGVLRLLIMIFVICIQEQEYLSQHIRSISKNEIIYQSSDGTLANASAHCFNSYIYTKHSY